MIKTMVVCDECGAQQNGETNWFVVETFKGFSVRKPKGHGDRENYPVLDICGQQCLHKQLDKFLST
jgi:hypothetical protein